MVQQIPAAHECDADSGEAQQPHTARAGEQAGGGADEKQAGQGAQAEGQHDEGALQGAGTLGGHQKHGVQKAAG